MIIKRFILFIMLLSGLEISAQLYTGMSGMIHVPDAEMFDEGEAQIGAYYMNHNFLPWSNKSGYKSFQYNGKPYNTADFYLSITPFKWIQIGYTFTLFKTLDPGYDKPKYNRKDRYISLKLNPIRERKWVPAIAIGSNDFLGSATKRHKGGKETSGYFCNYYLAATKHFGFIPKSEIGVTVAYRYAPNDYFKKWEGVVGGVTWRPTWYKNWRVIAEWSGNGVNIGSDILLWKHLFVQAAMIECRYFSGGLSYRVNLF